MTSPNARAAGTFQIAGRELSRLGFGAMQLTGSRAWGEPEDRAEARRILRRLPELGVNLIDTADSYCPFVSEDLVAEALHPYDGLLIATKAGLVRPGPGVWKPVGRPEYLRQSVQMSLRRLKVERIDLWQLQRIDPSVPRDEQFDAIAGFVKEGLIAAAGLSQVSVEEIDAARRHFAVATVQNRYNLTDRADDELVDYCEREGIGFIPWYLLASEAFAKPGGPVDAAAKARGATAGQIALAWVLQRSPVMLPIPGTSRVARLEKNVAAAALQLSAAEIAALDKSSTKASSGSGVRGPAARRKVVLSRLARWP